MLSLLIAEGMVRLVFPHPIVGGYPHIRQSIELNGRPSAIYTTNSLGLRGDEPPARASGRHTIMAVGGSTTHCWFLADEDTWPARLQTGLRSAGADVWVGNGGVEGHSTNAHLSFVREVVAELRPETVVFLVGINDLLISLEKRSSGGVHSAELDWERHLGVAHSRLLQVLAAVLRRVGQPAAEVVYRPWSEDRPLATPARPSSLTARAWIGLGRYRANLRELARETRALGARPVFLTQPMLYDDTPFWRGREAHNFLIGGTRPQVTRDHRAESLARSRLRQFGRRRRSVRKLTPRGPIDGTLARRVSPRAIAGRPAMACGLHQGRARYDPSTERGPRLDRHDG